MKQECFSFWKYIRSSEGNEKAFKFKWTTLKFLAPYIKQHYWKFIGSLALMLFLSLLALPIPYLMKFIVDDIIVEKNLGLLHLIIIALVVTQILKYVISLVTNFYISIFTQEMLVKIKKDLFSKILRYPFSFFDSQQTGYIFSRISEVDGLGYFFSHSMLKIIISFLEFLFCLGILFYLNFELTLISLAILPVMYFWTRQYSTSLRKTSMDLMEKGAEVTKKMQESLSGIEVIKSFAAETRESKKIHIFLDKLKQSVLRRNIQFNLSTETLSLIGAFGGFIVIWYSGWKIITGAFTIGTYIAFSGYLAKVYGPTQVMANAGPAFQPAVTALNRISELFRLTEEENTGFNFQSLKGEIVFEDVFFRYIGKKEDILKSINLNIAPGEKVLLTGPNGIGKSTLIKLILGFYKPYQGNIYLDGHNICTLSLLSLRERISIVSQNVFLFNESIKSNILYSKPEARQQELEAAAKKAGAIDFINKLELGFLTRIGETGKKLSGGERKKISIARAILKNSDIIIFDEAGASYNE